MGRARMSARPVWRLWPARHHHRPSPIEYLCCCQRRRTRAWNTSSNWVGMGWDGIDCASCCSIIRISARAVAVPYLTTTVYHSTCGFIRAAAAVVSLSLFSKLWMLSILSCSAHSYCCY
jgi:hypothetical protein